MLSMSGTPRVIIRCLVYNHEPYLRDCLEGFVMQRTNFPFKAVVHDDCSTDGSAAIIREYAEKYPDIIEPIYETENQYSKKDGSLGRIMDAATLGRSKYIAVCEGDDYWTDPLKLQKQVDYMDAHPECSMVCTNAMVEWGGTLKESKGCPWATPTKTGVLSLEDLVLLNGAYVFTCTILYRQNLKCDMPELARRCKVGDYPLQIFAALRGYVYYYNEVTAIYRYCRPGSWTEQHEKENIEGNKVDISFIQSVVDMLSAMNEYSNGQYKKLFIEAQLWTIYPILLQNPQQKEKILSALGWVLRYRYLAPHLKPSQQTIKEKIRFQIIRLLAWPYYPLPHVFRTLLPAWHPVSIMRRILRR